MPLGNMESCLHDAMRIEFYNSIESAAMAFCLNNTSRNTSEILCLMIKKNGKSSIKFYREDVDTIPVKYEATKC